MQLNAEGIAVRLGKAAKSGDGYKCCCPAHDDNNPSLSVWDRSDGSVGFKCYAECSYEDVKSELVSLGYLTNTIGGNSKRRPMGSGPAARLSTVIASVPADMPSPSWKDLGDREPDKIYEYRTVEGGLFGYVARWDSVSEGKKIRPFVVVDDGGPRWKSLGFPEPRPLYRANLLAANPSSKVLVVEGEKAADRAAELFPEYVVVTWQGGAKAFSKSDWSVTSGRDISLWADNDDAGRKAMKDLAELLGPIAKTVRVVKLPVTLPEKWDLGDDVPEGVIIEEMIREAPLVMTGLRAHILSASELALIEIPPRKHLVEPILVEGGLFMVYAERGLGKTWFALQLSIRLATGENFFGFRVRRKCRVLYIDGEMSMAELQERIRALEGDGADNLMLLPSERLFFEDRPLNISSAEDQKRILDVIAQLVREDRGPDLVVFDNLSSLSGGMDENDNTALDGLLRWLVSIKHGGTAVMLVHHAGKSGAQRGASRREDLLDTSIQLAKKKEKERGKKEEDAEFEIKHDGAEFVVTFPKTRGRRPTPDEFLLQLEERPYGRVAWIMNDNYEVRTEEKTLRVIAEKSPATQAELANLRNVSAGSMSQHCTMLRKLGYLSMKGLMVTEKGKAQLLKLWPELGDRINLQDDLDIPI